MAIALNSENKNKFRRRLNTAKKKQQYASTVDGVSGAAEFADLWKVHYSKLLILNQSDEENVSFADSVVHDLCLPTFFCTTQDVSTLLLKLPIGKSSGPDHMYTEHL